ncbi:uncharacterized protein [Hyperolius riggenbachi]
MIQNTLACNKVITAQGRGRYFLRLALNRKSIASAAQHLQHTQKLMEWYDPLFSVLGNEEHMEPFLSLLLVVSQSTFALQLQNASFLDESWILPICAIYQTVPCRELGMVLRYVDGRVIVIEVLPDSQTEIDEVVLAGDLIDEINGVSLRHAYNGQAGTVLSRIKGEPLEFRIIRWRWKNGEVFRPLIPYLKGVQERVPNFQLQQKPRNQERLQDTPQQDGRLLYSVNYLGRANVGMFGGKEILDVGISKVRKSNSTPKEVFLDIRETEVAVKDKESCEVLFHYLYPDISSVGRRVDNKRVFALCAIDTGGTPDTKSFNCFVFETINHKECEEMIKRIAAGFKHTEWFV